MPMAPGFHTKIALFTVLLCGPAAVADVKEASQATTK